MIDAKNGHSTLSTRLAMLAAVVATAAGCGPNIPAPPSTQPVHGQVKLNGEPVTKGFVRFVPEPGKGGRFAEGMIAEDGSYAVAAFKGQAGTLPGEYKVYFASQQNAAEGESLAPPLDLPKKYLSPETTDLKVTVSDGDNDIPLDLSGEKEETEEEAE
jgi:hypothetical protein